MTEATNWLVYALAVEGLVYLVTSAAIMLPVRVIICRVSNLASGLLYCPMCVAFWVGVAGVALPPGLTGSIPDRIVSGLIAMGLVSITTMAFGRPGPGQAYEVEEPLWRKSKVDAAS